MMQNAHAICIVFMLFAVGCGRAPHEAVNFDETQAPAIIQQARPLHSETVIPDDPEPTILQRYTFAAGDTMNLALYGDPDATRNGIRVAANGTINWLGYTEIPVAGKTVSEIRKQLEAMLTGHLYRRPVVMIQPQEIYGHRYYMLGKVVDKGSYPLDRPLRVLDAISRCRGIETGLQDSNTVEIADFDHSLLIRNGEVVPIDFKALILEGDLRFNIRVHPGDVMYFPSAMTNHVYVLGKVQNPGTQAYSTGMTLLGLLAKQGGIVADSWRDRLVVLRGKRNNPTVFTIDVDAILAGKLPDFPILPGDVVYLAEHPMEDWRRLSRIALNVFASVVGSRFGTETAQSSLR